MARSSNGYDVATEVAESAEGKRGREPTLYLSFSVLPVISVAILVE
jgi:hypothetical protein